MIYETIEIRKFDLEEPKRRGSPQRLTSSPKLRQRMEQKLYCRRVTQLLLLLSFLLLLLLVLLLAL